ncbi:MAG: EAL domain-containing protein [Burkholderiales bacterium]|nr:EAL domain-containing protein [Burkholderiales bacterium]
MSLSAHAAANPLQPAALIPTGGDIAVIARQPILDAKRGVIGYELLHRRNPAADPVADAESASTESAVMFSALSNIGSESLFGNKLAFVRCGAGELTGVHLEIVDPERIVLQVPAVEENAPDLIAAAAERFAELRTRGFRLAFGATVLTRPYAPWVPHASYIKLDLRRLKRESVPTAVRIAANQQHAQVIAENVESAAEFEMVRQLGVKFFQGFHFERPSAVTAKLSNPAYATVIQLINQVRKEADPATIEELLKRDPTLSFKLLRYINSAGFGLGVEVTSFRHAVMILGLKKLFRWAALLLTTIKSDSAPPVVANFAVTRARFMELLAAECLPPEDCDNAFLAGVFSLLDVMLGVPMEQALQDIVLPSDINDALIERAGLLAPFLQLVEACETADGTEIAELARALQLSSEQINRAHLDALVWSEQFAGG